MRLLMVGAAALAVALSSAAASASIVATEDFSGYTVGAPLHDQGDATGGWAGGWYPTTARDVSQSQVNKFVVKSTQNTFAPDYPSAAGGQSAGGGFERDFRPLTATTGKTFVSFVGAANLMNQFNLNITYDTDQSRVGGFVWSDIPADPVAGTPKQTGHQINYFNGDVATVMTNVRTDTKYESWTPLGPTSDTASDLYVITLDSATNEVGYYVFLNGTSPLTGTADYGVTITNDASRGTSFDRVGLFSIGSVGISDIRIGTTAADIGVSPNALVAVPEPASLGLLALGGLALLRRRK
jgi:hypothetical protein